jgi:hypothetical protein
VVDAAFANPSQRVDEFGSPDGSGNKDQQCRQQWRWLFQLFIEETLAARDWRRETAYRVD